MWYVLKTDVVKDKTEIVGNDTRTEAKENLLRACALQENYTLVKDKSEMCIDGIKYVTRTGNRRFSVYECKVIQHWTCTETKLVEIFRYTLVDYQHTGNNPQYVAGKMYVPVHIEKFVETYDKGFTVNLEDLTDTEVDTSSDEDSDEEGEEDDKKVSV